MIVDLIPSMDEHHLLVGLKEEKVASPKKTPEKKVVKKEDKEVDEWGGEKIKSSSELNDVFNVDYSAPPTKGRKKSRGDLSSQALQITTAFMTIMGRIDRVESVV